MRSALGVVLVLWTAVVAALEAPNVVVLSPQLVTSGQPAEASLTSLGQEGFKAVVYLVPTTMRDAIPREP
jgi:hypothetical protein